MDNKADGVHFRATLHHLPQFPQDAVLMVEIGPLPPAVLMAVADFIQKTAIKFLDEVNAIDASQIADMRTDGQRMM